MSSKIKIGILGYGNLGRGAEMALSHSIDMELVGVFTRRDPVAVRTLDLKTPVFPETSLLSMTDEIDVLILCGGSATDLPVQGPKYAAHFHTVDSFDTHAKIPAYYAEMDQIAKESGHISVISVGWDPGLFSINRVYGDAILPGCSQYTFWGKGVSQGHSDAIRRVPGVLDAVQYTVPAQEAIDAIRSGRFPALTTGEKHKRECYVVAEEGADKEKIEQQIKTMENYFSDYDTTVHFLSMETLRGEHANMPHGGFVLTGAETGGEHKQIVEFSLRLGSNPEFTAHVLVAYARAAHRLAAGGQTGVRTVLDIPPALVSPRKKEELLASFT